MNEAAAEARLRALLERCDELAALDPRSAPDAFASAVAEMDGLCREIGQLLGGTAPPRLAGPISDAAGLLAERCAELREHQQEVQRELRSVRAARRPKPTDTPPPAFISRRA